MSRILRIVDKKTANKFATLITQDLKGKQSTIIEANPGEGYLTEELLKARIGYLYLLEKNKNYVKRLESLNVKYPNCFNIMPYDIMNLYAIECSDKLSNTEHIKKIFSSMAKPCHWNDEPSMYIIGALRNFRFLYYLQQSMMARYLSNYGRIVLYLAISPHMEAVCYSILFINCTAHTDFSLKHMIQVLHDTSTIHHFQAPYIIYLKSLFDYEVLGCLPKNAFAPKQIIKRKKKNSNHSMNDFNNMLVVKFIPKQDFINDKFTRLDAELFFCFLYLICRGGDVRIIPALEKWIPGCGPRLIKLNYNIFTNFNDLKASELLHLFEEFRSWPEYKNSEFINLAEDLIAVRTK